MERTAEHGLFRNMKIGARAMVALSLMVAIIIGLGLYYGRSLRTLDESDTARFDEWLQLWPSARQYCVFAAVGEQIGRAALSVAYPSRSGVTLSVRAQAPAARFVRSPSRQLVPTERQTDGFGSGLTSIGRAGQDTKPIHA